VFEPLRFGAVPETSVPLVQYIVLAIILTGVAVPYIIKLFEATASVPLAWDDPSLAPEKKTD
jgi:hypothetical protein